MRGNCVSLLVMFLAGCASTGVRYADSSVTPDMLQESVENNHARVKGLSGSGTISFESPEMAQSGSFELTVKKPDSILVRIEGPFGIDVGSALVTRERLFLYNSFQNRLMEGPTNAGNFEKFLHIPLNFDDMVNLFTGGFFLSDDRSTPSEFSVEDDQFVLTYERYDGTRRYWVDPQTKQIVKIHYVDGNGKLAVEQIFSRFETVNDVKVPYYIRVTMMKERRRVSIAYSDLVINPPYLDFQFDVPPNASRSLLR